MFEELKKKALRDKSLAREMERDIAAQVLLVISECETLTARVRELERPPVTELSAPL
jgi:hypothetical protein